MHNHPDVSEVFCHLDYEFCDLMLSLPADWLYKRNFYAVMIYHSLPHLRHIIYANTGQRLSGTLTQFQRRDPPLAERILPAAKTLVRSLVPQQFIRALKPYDRGTATKYYDLFRLDDKLLDSVRECLYSVPSLKSILDITKADEFVRRYKSNGVDGFTYSTQTELMGMLVSMCTTFRDIDHLLAEQVSADRFRSNARLEGRSAQARTT
jgi:hypothetical protein